jgi:NAD-dependent deacetylase
LFEEAVPEINNAIPLVQKADIMAIIGTSLQVISCSRSYQLARKNIPVYLIDPNPSGAYPGIQII